MSSIPAETLPSGLVQLTSENSVASPSLVIHRRLQLCFALLTALGGIVLSGTEETQTLPFIAIFFAMFGYLFVDRLQWFALPPLLAYIAMGCVAIYCVVGFWDLETPGNRQMVSVANLLVMVQSILMLQKKTLRIFEQFSVFCLLQLVVGGVFNHAVIYGLLLIPMCLIAATALAFLSSLTVDQSQESAGVQPLLRRPVQPPRSGISVSGSESFQQASGAARGLPRNVLLTWVPAVVLIGAIFFYALPRTTDSARSGGGPAMVGFSDHLQLDQIGLMQQSSQIALRVWLKDRTTLKPYLAKEDIYLRGQVLDIYSRIVNRGGRVKTHWNSSSGGILSSNMSLPQEFRPENTEDQEPFDAVNVDVACEAIRSPSLFSIAPHYHYQTDRSIVHQPDRWTLRRKGSSTRVYPRIKYQFLTHAFRGGIQTTVLSEPSPSEQVMLRPDERQRHLLSIDREYLPTVVSTAERLSSELSADERTPIRIAERLESYLAMSNEFAYTLDLNRPNIPEMDPIEQFLAVDRRGHCQFFASTMVMMLRSQGIPARVVVGYRTDEYNDLGQYYLVRQLHAHAWVEALIDSQEVTQHRAIYGQPRTKHYWVRFDPTPSYSLSAGGESGVSSVLDIAQNIWDDYVVDMDGSRQGDGLGAGNSSSALMASYGRFFNWAEMRISAIRAGELGGGALAGRPGFSWIASITTVLFCILLLILSRMPRQVWWPKKTRRDTAAARHRPQFAFYQETLDQLERLGIQRGADMTPRELATAASDDPQHPDRNALEFPLETLTSVYYRLRYGTPLEEPAASPASDQATEELDEPHRSRVRTALSQLRVRIDQLTREPQPEQ